MVEFKQKQIKILILEDNQFYNKLIKTQLNKCFENYSITNNVQFNLNCYTHVEDLMLNINDQVDIAFIDYFLGSGITGNTIIPQIRRYNPDCEIAIMSLHDQAENRLKGITDQIRTFISKDRKALDEICDFVCTITRQKYPDIV